MKKYWRKSVVLFEIQTTESTDWKKRRKVLGKLKMLEKSISKVLKLSSNISYCRFLITDWATLIWIINIKMKNFPDTLCRIWDTSLWRKSMWNSWNISVINWFINIRNVWILEVIMSLMSKSISDTKTLIFMSWSIIWRMRNMWKRTWFRCLEGGFT